MRNYRSRHSHSGLGRLVEPKRRPEVDSARECVCGRGTGFIPADFFRPIRALPLSTNWLNTHKFIWDSLLRLLNFLTIYPREIFLWHRDWNRAPLDRHLYHRNMPNQQPIQDICPHPSILGARMPDRLHSGVAIARLEPLENFPGSYHIAKLIFSAWSDKEWAGELEVPVDEKGPSRSDRHDLVLNNRKLEGDDERVRDWRCYVSGKCGTIVIQKQYSLFSLTHQWEVSETDFDSDILLGSRMLQRLRNHAHPPHYSGSPRQYHQ